MKYEQKSFWVPFSVSTFLLLSLVRFCLLIHVDGNFWCCHCRSERLAHPYAEYSLIIKMFHRQLDQSNSTDSINWLVRFYTDYIDGKYRRSIDYANGPVQRFTKTENFSCDEISLCYFLTWENRSMLESTKEEEEWFRERKSWLLKFRYVAPWNA